jgi:hypothetical protein
MAQIQDSSNLQGSSETPDDPDYTNLERLPGEEGPVGDPDDISKKLDDTHPATDSEVDPDDEYNNGLSEAAGARDPEA